MDQDTAQMPPPPVLSSFSATNPPKLALVRNRTSTGANANRKRPLSPTPTPTDSSSFTVISIKQESGDDKFNQREDDSEYVQTTGPVTELMDTAEDHSDSGTTTPDTSINETELPEHDHDQLELSGTMDYTDMSLDEIIKLKKQGLGLDLSLDEIIAKRKGQRPMNGHRKTKRAAGARGTRAPGATRHKDRLVQLEQDPSPISILQKLEGDQETVEMNSAELASLVDMNNTHNDKDRKVRWRVEWHWKNLIGYGVGPRKVLASQIAALDLINKMRDGGFTKYMSPEPVIPKGCLITPFIYSLLDQKSKEAGTRSPQFICHFSRDKNRQKFYIARCELDGKIYEGVSYEETYAKRLAAKNAFDNIAGREFHVDEIVIGENVPGLDGYKSSHSNVHHVYQVKRPKMDDGNMDTNTQVKVEQTASKNSAEGMLDGHCLTITASAIDVARQRLAHGSNAAELGLEVVLPPPGTLTGLTVTVKNTNAIPNPSVAPIFGSTSGRGRMVPSTPAVQTPIQVTIPNVTPAVQTPIQVTIPNVTVTPVFETPKSTQMVRNPQFEDALGLDDDSEIYNMNPIEMYDVLQDTDDEWEIGPIVEG